MKIKNYIPVILLAFIFTYGCSKDELTNSLLDEPLVDGETGTVIDMDGNTYKTVTIGTQEWMAENLKVTKTSGGTAINLVTDSAAWVALADNNTDDAYCYYDNSMANRDTYGALYTYAAAKDACPTGWHLPSDSEWTILYTFISNDGHSGNVGTALKSTTGWYNNTSGNGTDDYGFSALPGGNRVGTLNSYYAGKFRSVGLGGIWWSNTEAGVGNWAAYAYSVVTSSGQEYLAFGDKSHGFSVRCVRD